MTTQEYTTAYKEHNLRLVNWIMFRSHWCRSTSEDIAANVWLIIWRRRKSLHFQEPWRLLSTIAKAEIVNRHNRDESRNWVEDDIDMYPSPSSIEEEPQDLSEIHPEYLPPEYRRKFDVMKELAFKAKDRPNLSDYARALGINRHSFQEVRKNLARKLVKEPVK